MSIPNYTKAKSEAENLLDKYQIQEPIVNVYEIAQNEGLQIQFVEMPEGNEDVAGFLDGNIIYVNKVDPSNRQTFTVAHELGHHVLKHKADDFGFLYRRFITAESSPIEMEANHFAANLLVPEKMLKDTMKKWNLDKEQVMTLAKLFGVSSDVMKIRLRKI